MIRKLAGRALPIIGKLHVLRNFYETRFNKCAAMRVRAGFTQTNRYSFSELPRHDILSMPALSPTMTEGKILKWTKNVGDKIEEGDILCDIETDKAAVGFEVQQTGYVAHIKEIKDEDVPLPVGTPLAVIVKKADQVKAFENFDFRQAFRSSKLKTIDEPAEPAPVVEAPPVSPPLSTPQQNTQPISNNRIIASPAAKTLASEKGIKLEDIGAGSGPQGRIIKQDVQGVKQAVSSSPAVASKSGAASFPDNPFEQIAVNSMRKTIASRLTESKTTIPHYYVSLSVEMDRISTLRSDINSNEKQNGVKISVNDIILKAMALALRDYPIVNSQWHGNVIKRFKHSDVSVAVATDGGLITPIVYRAETLGLIDIAKRTKDIAKRAREGKLDPREFIGGTSTISNLGMFGIDTVTSVINPPQSTILGVGKTQKKLLFDATSTDPNKPYRVAEVMEVIVSADHRVVDGAVAAQWLTRIKKYLENPQHMLL